MSQISSKNAVVLGISTDSVESHKRFARKYSLNFALLSDADHKMSDAYGVLLPAGLSNRVTFIIGPDAKIQHIDRSVNSQFSRDGSTLTTRHGQNLALILSDWRARIGQPIPVFSLADVRGKTVSWMSPGKKAAVIAFISVKCPASIRYDKRLADLAADPAYKNVTFLALYPNANESVSENQKHAEQAAFPFPVAKDERSSLADHFEARETPAVWVVDAKGTVAYSGAVDDNQDPAGVKSRYLKDALDAVLAGAPIATPETKAKGCAIKRARKK